MCRTPMTRVHTLALAECTYLQSAIYRCLILDDNCEIFQISDGQEERRVNAFYYVYLPTRAALTGLPQCGLQAQS